MCDGNSDVYKVQQGLEGSSNAYRTIGRVRYWLGSVPVALTTELNIGERGNTEQLPCAQYGQKKLNALSKQMHVSSVYVR